MREHRSRSGQAKLFVNAEIVARLREHCRHGLNLEHVFVQVSLKRTPGFSVIRARQTSSIASDADSGEARRHGVEQSPYSMEAADQVRTLAVGALRGAMQFRALGSGRPP